MVAAIRRSVPSSRTTWSALSRPDPLGLRPAWSFPGWRRRPAAWRTFLCSLTGQHLKRHGTLTKRWGLFRSRNSGRDLPARDGTRSTSTALTGPECSAIEHCKLTEEVARWGFVPAYDNDRTTTSPRDQRAQWRHFRGYEATGLTGFMQAWYNRSVLVTPAVDQAIGKEFGDW